MDRKLSMVTKWTAFSLFTIFLAVSTPLFFFDTPGAQAAVNVKSGTFYKKTSPGTQQITGVGFLPKAVIFFATKQTALGNAIGNYVGVGVTAGSSNSASISAWSDRSDPSNTGRKNSVTNAIQLQTTGGTDAGQATLDSFDTDGFVLNWTSADVNPYIIHYFAIGGSDITNATTSTIFINTADTTRSVSDLSFQPDMLFFINGGNITATGTDQAIAKLGIGFGNNSTDQGGLGVLWEDGAASSDTCSIERVDQIEGLSNTCNTIDSLANISSIDANGFTLNISDLPTAVTPVHFLALKGGSYKTGNFTKPTSASYATTTGLSFRPDGLFLLSRNKVSGTTATKDGGISMGAAASTTSSGTDQGAISINEPDQDQANDENGNRTSTSTVFTAFEGDTDTLTGEAAFTRFNSDGFTLQWTTADATADEIMYWAIGDARLSISGTCKQNDQSTNCTDTGTIRVAYDGIVQSQTQTIVSGTWSVTNMDAPVAGTVVTVFIDGVVSSEDRAVAVAKYSGSNITGMQLIEGRLSIGSDNDQTVSNADLSQYDNSVSGDANIPIEVSVSNDLTVDSNSSWTTDELYIGSGDTYRPDSTSGGDVNAQDVENNGTITADGNTFNVTGAWVNSGTFTADTSTVSLSGAASQNLSGTMTGASAFKNLTILNTSGTGGGTQSIIFGAAASTTGLFTMAASTSAQFLVNATSSFSSISFGGTSAAMRTWLRSSSAGTRAGFVATTSASVSYVDVKDISSCGDPQSQTITATDSFNTGNNCGWDFISPIILSGTLYAMDETTAVTTSKTIKVAIGTTTPGVYTTTSSAADGTWSVSSMFTPFIGQRFIAWVDGDPNFVAATFTKASSTANNIPKIDLYQNRVTVKHEGFTGTSTTNSDLAFYDATDDGDIQFDATAGGALAVNSREELHIAPGTEFAPGGNVTLHGQASTTNPDGDLHLASGARQDGAATSSILTMTANTLKLAGNWFASSTSKFISSASTYFNATTTGKTIFATTTPFTNLYFTGTGGGWTIMGSSTVTNTLAATTTNMALSFGAYATSTVNNLELNGQNSGTPLVLRSSVTGSPWGLAATGTQSVSYVDVKDSNACLGLNLIATNGTNVDAGGNDCWEFSTGTLFKQGSFFKKTSTGNQSIAGVGFQPKALIFYWTRQAKPGFNATSSIGIGFVSGTSNERAISWTEEDNAATSVTGLRVSESRAIILLSQSTPVLGAQAELASMDSDGFTLNWTDNDSQATLLNYVAIGGSGVDAWAGSFTASTTGATQATSTLNFKPDTVFFIPTVTTAFLDSNQSSTYTHGIGLASSPSELGTINVASANGDTTNAQKVSQQLTSASFNRNAPSGVQESLGSLSSMNPDGFTFTWSDNPSGEIEVFFLAIGGANMKVGSFDQPTVSGNQSVTGTGFKPSGVMFFSDNLPAQAGIVSTSTISIGAASASTTRGSIWAQGRAVDPSDSNMYVSRNKALTLANSNTVNAEANVASFDNNGFTLNWNKIDSVQRQILYWAVGQYGTSTTISSAANQTFNVGGATTTNSAITITSDPVNPSFSGSNDIRVKIDGDFPMEWDVNDLVVTLSGTASSSQKIATSTMIDWRKIGGNGKNGSWTGAGTGEPESIYRLVTFNNKLYASTVNFDSSGAAEVWEFSSSTWTKIGGDGVNNSWDSAPEHEFADALTVFNDKLYVGLGFDNNDGEVWEWTSPTSWTKIGGDGTGTSWATSVRVRDIISYTNPGGYTALYAGKGATNDAEVWRYSATSTAWEVIAGNGENGSWSANEYNIVRDFFVMDGLLYVSTAEDLGDADVWEYNGSTWTQIGGDSINSSWDGATHPAVTQLGSFNGKLYANTGTGAAAEIWEWTSPTDWTQVGGGGVNGSWTNNELSETLPLVEYRGQFYVGLHDNESVSPTHYAEVWRWPGTGDWAKVAGGGVHNSWQDDIADVVGGLVEFDGKLIAGFGLLTPNQFGAQVWEMRIGPISYENSSKTLVINATTTLPAGSTLIIENLGFGNFTATHSASTTIRLCADGSCDATAATDDKTKTINAAAPASITLFGTLFGMDETTPMTGVSKTIKIAIGTSTPGVFATTTTSGNGTWSIASLPQPFIGERFLAWVAGDTTFRAATFTKASSTANDITGIDLYQNRVTIKHEGFTGTSTTNTDLAFYDATNDGDIQFDATAGGALAVNSREELHIAPGTEFKPGGAVTLHGQASTTNPDGDLHLPVGARQDGTASSSILTMADNELDLAGNWFASSTALYNVTTNTTLFNSTSTAQKSIIATSTPFSHLTFNGSAGISSWTFGANAATTTGDFYIVSGTVTAPTLLSIAGNFSNSGTFTAGSGTTTLNGTVLQTLSGTMIGTSAFSNLEILNSSATTSFAAAASTTGNFYAVTPGSRIEFKALATTTLQNLIVSGGSGNQVYLHSATPASQWYLHVPGNRSLLYANVKDSMACADGSSDINASDSSNTDGGNNLCWSFLGGNLLLSAVANQTFAVSDDSTAISMLTITDAATPSITATNKLRVAIATSTTFMLWDTTDTMAVFGGTASSSEKISSAVVTYEGGGSVLVVPVGTNFSSLDTLTISGLSFTSFTVASAPLPGLKLFIGGASDQTGDATDDKTIAIRGTLAGDEHAAAQVSNAIDSSDTSFTEALLYGFNLALAGDENMSITNLPFDASGVQGIVTEDITNAALFVDYNGDQAVDAGDTQVGGAGAVSISGETGTLTFSSAFTATTTRDYLLRADVADVKFGDSMALALTPSNVTASGLTSLLATTPASIVALTTAQHAKIPRGGGGGGVGGGAPAGQGIREGGVPGSGEEIGSSPDFFPPTTSGGTFDQWTSPSDAFASDGAYATAADTLKEDYGGFGFSIPGSNTITGIEVKLEISGTQAVGDIQVELSWDGGSSVTSAEATPTLTTTDAVVTVGGPANTWGRTWEPANFSDANFKVRVTANGAGTAQIDAIQVNVHDIAGGGTPGGGGEALGPQTRYLASVYAGSTGSLQEAGAMFLKRFVEKLNYVLFSF